MTQGSYDAYLNKVLKGVGPVSETPGGSGYFSNPEPNLDPDLFDGENLKPDVRDHLLSTLYQYLDTKYSEARKWTEVWLAGSGISYQWSANRSNGDLDVLVGVDFPRFWAANADFVGFSEDEMADIINRDLKEHLWPLTAATKIGSKIYEVTYYVNAGATDIRAIHPYAAYDLTSNKWTIHPSHHPQANFPKDWWDHVQSERNMAQGMVEKYNTLQRSLSVVPVGSAAWANNLSAMGLVVDQAKTLFDDIHLGRKKAFAPTGRGYGDFYNFRWQAHKNFGTMQALAALSQVRREARDEFEKSTYGEPLDDAHTALTKAALWNRGGNGRTT